MHRNFLFLIACLVSFWVPFWPEGETSGNGSHLFPGWPEDISAHPLRAVPLQSQEESFAKLFPGKIGRFSDGENEWIIRWVVQPTRLLHPAVDCFRGSGYQIHPLPLKEDPDRSYWGVFKASKSNETLLVHERIYDDHGQSWPDVSAWYWTALFGRSTGPWWAVTRVCRLPLANDPLPNP